MLRIPAILTITSWLLMLTILLFPTRSSSTAGGVWNDIANFGILLPNALSFVWVYTNLYRALPENYPSFILTALIVEANVIFTADVFWIPGTLFNLCCLPLLFFVKGPLHRSYHFLLPTLLVWLLSLPTTWTSLFLLSLARELNLYFLPPWLFLIVGLLMLPGISMLTFLRLRNVGAFPFPYLYFSVSVQFLLSCAIIIAYLFSVF